MSRNIQQCERDSFRAPCHARTHRAPVVHSSVGPQLFYFLELHWKIHLTVGFALFCLNVFGPVELLKCATISILACAILSLQSYFVAHLFVSRLMITHFLFQDRETTFALGLRQHLYFRTITTARYLFCFRTIVAHTNDGPVTRTHSIISHVSGDILSTSSCVRSSENNKTPTTLRAHLNGEH